MPKYRKKPIVIEAEQYVEYDKLVIGMGKHSMYPDDWDEQREGLFRNGMEETRHRAGICSGVCYYCWKDKLKAPTLRTWIRRFLRRYLGVVSRET